MLQRCWPPSWCHNKLGWTLRLSNHWAMCGISNDAAVPSCGISVNSPLCCHMELVYHIMCLWHYALRDRTHGTLPINHIICKCVARSQPCCRPVQPRNGNELVEPDLDNALTTAISKLLCVFLPMLMSATTIKTHKLQCAFFCPSWYYDITHDGCIKYLFCLTLQLDWHLLPYQHAGWPLCSLRLKEKAQSNSCVFTSRHIFTANF